MNKQLLKKINQKLLNKKTLNYHLKFFKNKKAFIINAKCKINGFYKYQFSKPLNL